jgi:hypothetical protein
MKRLLVGGSQTAAVIAAVVLLSFAVSANQ